MTSKNIRFSLQENLYRLLISLLTIHLLFFSSLANSAEVFRQSPLDSGDAFASFDVEQSSDDFLLSANSTITGIKWWGNYFDDSFTNKSFDINFFMDDGGVPEEIPFQSFSFTGLNGDNSENLIDSFGFDVFSFEATLSPFDLLANRNYYVSIVSLDDTVEFYWQLSDNSGTNFYRDITFDPIEPWLDDPSGNLAFALQGNQATQIPEPDTLTLLVLVFLGMSFQQYSTKS